MSETEAVQQLRALSWLAQRLASDPDGDPLADALDMLVGATSATAAAALSIDLEPLQETGFAPIYLSDTPELRVALRSLALQGVNARRAVLIEDIHTRLLRVDDVSCLSDIGCTAAVSVPIEYSREQLGAFVLLLPQQSSFDRNDLGFVSAVSGMVALVLRESAPRLAKPSLESSDERATRTGVGMLSATVSHELRGPVVALTLQLEEQRELLQQLSLIEDSSDSAAGGIVAQLTELTEDIEATVAHLQSTTEQLSSVGKTSNTIEDFDFGALVEEHVSVALPLLERHGIAVKTQLEPGCAIQGRRDQLGQVIVKLVFHAADACHSSNCPPEVCIKVQSDGDRIQFTVTDTGIPIPEAEAHRWFEALGPHANSDAEVDLRMCADVVAMHGGHVEVSHPDGAGNALRVVLPRLAAFRQRSSDGAGWAPQIVGPQVRQLLTVDDDPIFVRTVRRALKPHEVRSATTASEAEIALFDSSYLPDLVLCDIFLPGANGDVMHARVSESRPELASRFVFITGGALSKTQADYLRNSGCLTMIKPVDFKEIFRMLESTSTRGMGSAETNGRNRA